MEVSVFRPSAWDDRSFVQHRSYPPGTINEKVGRGLRATDEKLSETLQILTKMDSWYISADTVYEHQEKLL